MALFNPSVPAKLPIQQLRTNDLIFVNGVAHSGKFAINLETGNNDVAFHFNPRFNERQVVRNTKTGGGWGGEERHGGFPFHEGQPFEVVILVHDAHYKIAVNGAHYAEYNHRLPKESIRELVVKGDVQLHAVRYQPANPYGYVPTPAGPSAPVFNPPLPYTGPITGGFAPGRMIRITGVGRGSRFSVNLQSGGHDGANIGMHFDVRFNHGSDHNVVVRNSLVNGGWGSEERHGPQFPFSANNQFDIIILAEAGCFKVAVNNQHYIEYAHRIPLASISHLNIQGDAQIFMVQIQ